MRNSENVIFCYVLVHFTLNLHFSINFLQIEIYGCTCLFADSLCQGHIHNNLHYQLKISCIWYQYLILSPFTTCPTTDISTLASYIYIYMKSMYCQFRYSYYNDDIIFWLDPISNFVRQIQLEWHSYFITSKVYGKILYGYKFRTKKIPFNVM